MVYYLAIVQNRTTLEPSNFMIRGEDSLQSFFRRFNPHEEALVEVRFLGEFLDYEEWKSSNDKSDGLNFG